MEAIKCECCAASISPESKACPQCGHPTNRKRAESPHESLAWAVVFIASIFSLIGVVVAMFVEDNISAPQQCAAVAACIGFTVIPYCYARAVEKF